MANAGTPAPATGNESLRTIGLSLALTLVVGLICTRAEIDAYLTEAFTATAGAVPAGLGVLTHRKRVRAALAAGQAAPRRVAPALAMILTAAVLLIVDSILGAYSFSTGDPDTINTVGYVSLAIMAIGIGYASKWFVTGPYRWALTTVGVIFLARLVIIFLYDPSLLDLVFEDLFVVYLKLAAGTVAATFIAIALRRRGPSQPVPAPSAPLATPYPGSGYPPSAPTAYSPAPPTVPVPVPPTVPASAPSGPPAGWYADPELRGIVRYWDGTQWTEHRRNA